MIENVMTLERAYQILSWESESFEGAIEGDEEDRKDYVSDLFRKAHAEELYTAQQFILKTVTYLMKGATQDGQGKDYPRAS